jgi:type I restriction enzyme M protein
MPTKGKADFMFVQHMVASLNNAGRMAVIMPHGVLFRGGEERLFRKWLIEKGYLEAVIGLPPALFYGTGIPASVIVVNKKDAHLRDNVLFINADREFKEGKVQNKLRPEDIEKISYVYRHKVALPKYSKLVSQAELAAEEYNLNIRRYVDNAPPAEPHDVHAHLKGGIPEKEVTALDPIFTAYPGLKARLFDPLKKDYLVFKADIAQKEDLKVFCEDSSEITATHNQYTTQLNAWWAGVLPRFEALPDNKNIFDLYHAFSASFTAAIATLTTGQQTILDAFQSRGALAAYWDALETDLKSVAASGWNAELIPDEEILESQFPEVLQELRDNEADKEAIEAQFKEVNELEAEAWNEDEYTVWHKEVLATHKESIKVLKGDLKEVHKDLANLKKRITANLKAAKEDAELLKEVEILRGQHDALLPNIQALSDKIDTDEARFAPHTAMEERLKACKKIIGDIKKQKQELVDEARLRITPEAAQLLILDRWQRTLHTTINDYLQTHSRALAQALDNLYGKYTTTLDSVLKEREKETVLLNTFLKELGYE